MTDRIVGLETEYGVVVVPAGDLDPAEEVVPTVEEAVTLMFEATPHAHRTTNHFLGNGARLYVDIGSHPEYASAECDRLTDVVANDRAGDLLVADLAAAANARLAELGVRARIHVLRNNVDSAGNTFGCHENYQVRRDQDFDRLTSAMTAFLASRVVLTGAGHVVAGAGEGRHVAGAGEGRHVFSARAEHMGAMVSADPTRDRPLINTKDEPHADRARWRRLHVLSGDSNVAECSTALKLGWTRLVLDLLEAGGDVSDLVPLEPLRAMRTFNGDAHARVPTAGGDDLAAIDLQEAFLSRVERHLGPGERDPETTWVLDLVATGLRALRENRPDLVDTRLDWAIKRRVLDEYARARGLRLADDRVTRLAYAYHDIDPGGGLAPRLRRAGHLERFVTDEAVAAARTTPPATTRARVRGRFVAWVEERGYHASVDWSSVRLNRPIGPHVDLPDAAAPASPEVEEVMDRF